MNPKILDQKTGSSKNKVKRRSHKTPVGSIQGGFPLPTVNTNPDDYDDDDNDDDTR